MNTHLTRIATMVLANLLIGAAVTPIEAQQAVPAILFNQDSLGIDYVVRPLSNGENYIKITGIHAGSPAARAGLQAGDWISKIGNLRVRDRRSLDRGVFGAMGRIRLRTWDSNSRRWMWVSVNLGAIGPDPGAGPQLTGIWQSSGGGTVHFRGSTPNLIHAESNVPWVGASDMSITPNLDGSYNFTYQQRGGFRDSGHGKLTPLNANTINGYLVNGLGIRADFVLTR
ncbi:MAG: PDZ domain-containing protein [Planctomycetota bacterium]|nr:PDZ domain-containing protein [Planctomycetota bacterium]